MTLSTLYATIVIGLILAFGLVLTFVFLRTPLGKTLQRLAILFLFVGLLAAIAIVGIDTWVNDIV